MIEAFGALKELKGMARRRGGGGVGEGGRGQAAGEGAKINWLVLYSNGSLLKLPSLLIFATHSLSRHLPLSLPCLLAQLFTHTASPFPYTLRTHCAHTIPFHSRQWNFWYGVSHAVDGSKSRLHNDPEGTAVR